MVEYHGEIMTLSQAIRRGNLPRGTVKSRFLEHGWPIDRAVDEPAI